MFYQKESKNVLIIETGKEILYTAKQEMYAVSQNCLISKLEARGSPRFDRLFMYIVQSTE